MLQQILVKTPVYVWAILAFLVYRGVLAAREREITYTRMLVIPLLMLVLALQSIATQFGVASIGMAAWSAGLVALVLQRWTFGSANAVPGAAAKTARIRGSWTPLAMMMSVFLIKYALAVTLAIRPGMVGDAVFAATVCGLLGLCNGYFVGQLARDLSTLRTRSAPCPASA
ncbi:DUF6622 family protein [Massilia sp. LjRoot122]|uniref:DUF6622 family protein n=1 Tax=Massilia sp. LjRoot122 TaxID=3342257 RepID=UPI003ED07937